jgi:hypothetical protein
VFEFAEIFCYEFADFVVSGINNSADQKILSWPKIFNACCTYIQYILLACLCFLYIPFTRDGSLVNVAVSILTGGVIGRAHHWSAVSLTPPTIGHRCHRHRPPFFSGVMYTTNHLPLIFKQNMYNWPIDEDIRLGIFWWAVALTSPTSGQRYHWHRPLVVSGDIDTSHQRCHWQRRPQIGEFNVESRRIRIHIRKGIIFSWKHQKLKIFVHSPSRTSSTFYSFLIVIQTDTVVWLSILSLNEIKSTPARTGTKSKPWRK